MISVQHQINASHYFQNYYNGTFYLKHSVFIKKYSFNASDFCSNADENII